MLNTTYTVIAKAIVVRWTSPLQKWVKKEQKGLEKGRQILDAIIDLWEGIDNAKKTNQDFFYPKVDLDNTYEKIGFSLLSKLWVSLHLLYLKTFLAMLEQGGL